MLTISNGLGDLDFLTWCPSDKNQSPFEQMVEATRQIAEHLEVSGAVLLHQRVYGDLDWAGRLGEARQRVGREFGTQDQLPMTCVEGRACDGSPMAGIHAISARPANPENTSLVYWNGQVGGRQVEGLDARYLYLQDLARFVPPDNQESPGEETGAAFDATRAILKNLGWEFGDVCRTWFYLRDILDWYDDFNSVRNRHFEELGLFNSDADAMIPASTGILGSNPRGGWCTLDLLAVREASAGPIRIKRLANPYQNEAPDYGSAFSRGLALGMGKSNYVLVSGTASIDDAGISIHVGDFERQTLQTLDTIGALLDQGGASWGDVCQATAFIKRPEDVAVYQRLIRDRGLQDLPIVCTIADVCREELLFELDATAIPSKK